MLVTPFFRTIPPTTVYEPVLGPVYNYRPYDLFCVETQLSPLFASYGLLLEWLSERMDNRMVLMIRNQSRIDGVREPIPADILSRLQQELDRIVFNHRGLCLLFDPELGWKGFSKHWLRSITPELTITDRYRPLLLEGRIYLQLEPHTDYKVDYGGAFSELSTQLDSHYSEGVIRCDSLFAARWGLLPLQADLNMNVKYGFEAPLEATWIGPGDHTVGRPNAERRLPPIGVFSEVEVGEVDPRIEALSPRPIPPMPEDDIILEMVKRTLPPTSIFSEIEVGDVDPEVELLGPFPVPPMEYGMHIAQESELFNPDHLERQDRDQLTPHPEPLPALYRPSWWDGRISSDPVLLLQGLMVNRGRLTMQLEADPKIKHALAGFRPLWLQGGLVTVRFAGWRQLQAFTELYHNVKGRLGELEEVETQQASLADLSSIKDEPHIRLYRSDDSERPIVLSRPLSLLDAKNSTDANSKLQG